MYCGFTYNVLVKYSVPESCFFYNYCAISNQCMLNIIHYYLRTFSLEGGGGNCLLMGTWKFQLHAG